MTFRWLGGNSKATFLLIGTNVRTTVGTQHAAPLRRIPGAAQLGIRLSAVSVSGNPR
jgi:hypothetical protein